MGELATLPNIAAKTEEQLLKVGIDTIDELRRVGSRGAWLRILAQDPSACIHRLLGLEGAVQNVRKAHLDEQAREDLREFY